MLAEQLTKFVELTEQRKSLEEQLDRTKKDAALVEQQLLGEFERAGVSSAKCNGHTVYLHRTMAVRPKADRESVCQALIKAGLAEYVNAEPQFNTASLTAYVKEQDRNGEPIPECLREALEVIDLYFIRTRKAG